MSMLGEQILCISCFWVHAPTASSVCSTAPMHCRGPHKEEGLCLTYCSALTILKALNFRTRVPCSLEHYVVRCQGGRKHCLPLKQAALS